MSSSIRAYKQFEEQQKKLLAQHEELVNLEEGGGGNEAFAMEEDEDDDHRRQRVSHSSRVMEAVGQISKPISAGNFDRKREKRGTQNDLNVLAQSPVFDEVLQGKAPRVIYSVNGHTYDRPYYLVDGIYPRSAARMFDVEALRYIMMTCIILHNMIVEDEYDYDAINEYEPDTMNNSRTRIYCAHDGTEDPVQHEPLERDGHYNQLIAERYTSLQEPYWHCTRQNDLIEHQWGLQ
ncbi:uncharacterized protein [Pyrus communis]|uniref:uncharacterized protein n=1 Tax=Pyrus communis TaxID=23211 RepID=UPI0035BFCD6D